jgi:hypothetical protein
MTTVKIHTDNDAFADGNGASEVARILRKIADEIESGVRGNHVVLDLNGNKAGSYATGHLDNA